ncbi:uncharacterized protein [Excalfactoria chinensis]|uniref:uncharacterized protein n=1 Tax=Excalfactoria chinensis TaxID=46218 RepID=UPI003B3ABB18
MENVIKVLSQFCKDYCGKNVPTKKDITAVLSCLEREGELASPTDILDHHRWDVLTSALAQHTMSMQEAGELKTWGLILGALKTAREEGKVEDVACSLLGLGQGSGGTQLGGEGGIPPSPNAAGEDGSKMVPAAPSPPAGSLEDKGQDSANTPTVPKPDEGILSQTTDAPPPNPHQPLYPSLCIVPPSPFNGGPSQGGGEDSQKGVFSAIVSLPQKRKADACGSTQESQEGKSIKPTDCSKIRKTIEDKGLSVPTDIFPGIIMDDRGPQWAPLDPKGIARLIEATEKKGLRSPGTLNALESLAAQSPMLPHDIKNLMSMILKPVQYTLWKEEWLAQLKKTVESAQDDPNHPVHGTTLLRLTGAEPATPLRQVAFLRPVELLASTDAALEAFRTFARSEKPSTPWSDITQGPTESFQEFADRLIKAIEGSELPRAVHSPVIMDCLKQRSHESVRDLICAAPGKISTPEELIKYVLDKQKAIPLTSEGLAAALTEAMAATPALAQGKVSNGPCFRCGQLGHIKAQCNASKPVGKSQLTCQLCDQNGHNARECRSFRALQRENENERWSQDHGPSHSPLNEPRMTPRTNPPPHARPRCGPAPPTIPVPSQKYAAPSQKYAAPSQKYTAPSQKYTDPSQKYTAPSQRYSARPPWP